MQGIRQVRLAGTGKVYEVRQNLVLVQPMKIPTPPTMFDDSQQLLHLGLMILDWCVCTLTEKMVTERQSGQRFAGATQLATGRR